MSIGKLLTISLVHFRKLAITSTKKGDRQLNRCKVKL